MTFFITKPNLFHSQDQSHVTEPKSFFLETRFVHPDQAFSFIVIFIPKDLAFHPSSSFFLLPRLNLTSSHIQLGKFQVTMQQGGIEIILYLGIKLT